MRVGCKILAGYLAIALCTGVVGYLGVHFIGIIEQRFNGVANETIPDLRALYELKFGALRVISSTTESALLGQITTRGRKSGEEGAEEVHLLTDARLVMTVAMERYKASASIKSENERKIVLRLEKEIAAFLQDSETIQQMANSGASDKDLLEQKEIFETDESSLLGTIDDALHYEASEFDREEHNVHLAIKNASHMIAMFSIVTFLLALGGGIVLAALISRRILRLQLAAERIGKGELATAIAIDSQDELGKLAASLNEMASSLQQSRSEFISVGIYLSDIIHSLNESLIVVSPTGMVEMVNAATCTLLGSEEELVGQPFSRILTESPFTELMEKGVIRAEEKTYVTQDGREIPVAFSGSVMWKADGQIKGIVCVAHDISERKRAEEQACRFAQQLQESNNEIRSFAYIVSHDLRAPLVNIKGFAAELSGGINDADSLVQKITPHLEEQDRQRMNEIFREDVPEALEFINASVNRMDGMIGAILKLSRFGHQQLKPESIDLEQLVRGILQTLAHQLEARSVEVEVGVLPELNVDRTAIGQIIGNLLDNAVKYLAPDRPGRLEITFESGDRKAIVHIRDNGRGIASEDMGKVFEIFRRAGRLDVPGEGMGLAYVKALVKRLGGEIWCESELGVGSVFSFTVPEETGLTFTA